MTELALVVSLETRYVRMFQRPVSERKRKRRGKGETAFVLSAFSLFDSKYIIVGGGQYRTRQAFSILVKILFFPNPPPGKKKKIALTKKGRKRE